MASIVTGSCHSGDPAALRDDYAIADLHTKIEQSADELERLQLRHQLFDQQTPPLDNAGKPRDTAPTLLGF